MACTLNTIINALRWGNSSLSVQFYFCILGLAQFKNIVTTRKLVVELNQVQQSKMYFMVFPKVLKGKKGTKPDNWVCMRNCGGSQVVATLCFV